MSSIGQKAFAAFLFDMDGTILNSLAATERVWTRWAEKHGVDAAALMLTMHGKRAVDTIRGIGLPGIDVEREAANLTDAEVDDVGGVEAIDGAVAFLSSLPVDRWAIVTSAPLNLATARLGAAGIKPPPVLVTAEDVTQGKPKPDCYQLAAKKLGFDVRDCLVFEDAPAGIKAGEAAGAAVAVVMATHDHSAETPHFSFSSYGTLRAELHGAGLRLREIEPA